MESHPADPGTPTPERVPPVRSGHGPDGHLQTPPVLPRRVRNASLAEQLRAAHVTAAMTPPDACPATAPAGSSSTAEDRTPEGSRTTMAAIQRATRAARAADQEPDAPSGPPLPPTPATPPAPPAAKEHQ